MLETLKDKSILFLEDNLEFAQNTIVLLNIFIKTIYHVVTISQAKAILKSRHVDIIICDIKLKNENGLDFIKEIRSSDLLTPIMIISGHKDESFLFRAIPLYLSAYLLKPIKYEELIEALQICSEKIIINSKEKINLKDGWCFDTKLCILKKDEEEYALNKKEAQFMKLIAYNSERLITKEMLHESVWEFEDMSDSAVTNFMLRIRRRFGKNFIYTIPDLGFRFNIH
ncbi:two component transcriptional regulator, winged helix family [Sulfurimonas denitrificans DSM 1251]|uniref:Two component transcriptional regulator, winged helix family n=1 Tax=Sulfurimonas denitrificans (strain ATCC 33889 / DSM 1251) TaxID=326298 RepID=Q30U03_SULDN|nr:response regulator [Sulfurimonas denitrificans]ABB43528.1 two component transcriptional regulator, winged helix family [Sulfurimonas denitrificans DSM 1251]